MMETSLAAERFEKIKAILKLRGVVTVDDLCNEFKVSPATVRRDLAELDEKALLRRVHGGAVCIEGRLVEPVFDDKTEIAVKEKQRIAEAAQRFIKPDDSIFLDGGSTVLALARMLTDMNRLTVVTNSLRVASTFASRGPRTILIGGELRRLSQTFVGPLTRPLIEQLHVDTAFMGTIGLTPERGMTTTDAGEAMTKELVMARARQVVLLADSTKIGKVSFVDFGSLEQVNTIITDIKADEKATRLFRKQNIKIINA